VRLFVPREKLVAYLLNPKHPEGGSKARFFMALGFAPDAPEAEEVSRQPGHLGQGLVLVLRGPLRGPRRKVFSRASGTLRERWLVW